MYEYKINNIKLKTKINFAAAGIAKNDRGFH